MFGSPPHFVGRGRGSRRPSSGSSRRRSARRRRRPSTWGSIVRRDHRREAAAVLAEDRRVCLVAHPPEPACAAEGELGARHLADRPARARRSRSMTGSHMPGRLAPPITFAFWFSRQCAMNATFATRHAPEVEQRPCRASPAPACRSNAAACLAGREDTVDERHDPARREMRDDLARERLHGRRLLLERAGAEHRCRSGAPACPSASAAQRSRVAPAPGADDHDAALDRESVEVALEVRRADELEHDVRAARVRRARATSSSGAITSAPSAATRSRTLGRATVASTRAPAAAPIWTAAVPTPPFAPLTTSSSPSRSRPSVRPRRAR